MTLAVVLDTATRSVDSAAASSASTGMFALACGLDRRVGHLARFVPAKEWQDIIPAP